MGRENQNSNSMGIIPYRDLIRARRDIKTKIPVLATSHNLCALPRLSRKPGYRSTLTMKPSKYSHHITITLEHVRQIFARLVNRLLRSLCPHQ